MEKNEAINLATDALRHLIKEKSKDIIKITEADLGRGLERQDKILNWEKAIKVLEGMRDANKT